MKNYHKLNKQTDRKRISSKKVPGNDKSSKHDKRVQTLNKWQLTKWQNGVSSK